MWRHMKTRTLEHKIQTLLPETSGPYRVIAYEMIREDGSWSVNTPFCIGSRLDRDGVLEAARNRWEVFKVNYLPKARVCDIQDISDVTYTSELEVDCTPFLRIQQED